MANSVRRYLMPSSKRTTSGLYRLILVNTGSGMTEEPVGLIVVEGGKERLEGLERDSRRDSESGVSGGGGECWRRVRGSRKEKETSIGCEKVIDVITQ